MSNHRLIFIHAQARMGLWGRKKTGDLTAFLVAFWWFSRRRPLVIFQNCRQKQSPSLLPALTAWPAQHYTSRLSKNKAANWASSGFVTAELWSQDSEFNKNRRLIKTWRKKEDSRRQNLSSGNYWKVLRSHQKTVSGFKGQRNHVFSERNLCSCK